MRSMDCGLLGPGWTTWRTCVLMDCRVGSTQASKSPTDSTQASKSPTALDVSDFVELYKLYYLSFLLQCGIVEAWIATTWLVQSHPSSSISYFPYFFFILLSLCCICPSLLPLLSFFLISLLLISLNINFSFPKVLDFFI